MKDKLIRFMREQYNASLITWKCDSVGLFTSSKNAYIVVFSEESFSVYHQMDCYVMKNGEIVNDDDLTS